MKNSLATSVSVVLQVAIKDVDEAAIPTEPDFSRWAGEALDDNDFPGGPPEVCVRIVDSDESAELNRRYRGASRPADVLSFACDEASLPDEEDEPYPLGDIVIAAPLVVAEAREQGKQVIARWAHLFVHGMLHLQGYDHIRKEDAHRMETREVDILRKLGFRNPYLGDNHLSDE